MPNSEVTAYRFLNRRSYSPLSLSSRRRSSRFGTSAVPDGRRCPPPPPNLSAPASTWPEGPRLCRFSLRRALLRPPPRLSPSSSSSSELTDGEREASRRRPPSRRLRLPAPAPSRDACRRPDLSRRRRRRREDGDGRRRAVDAVESVSESE
ncbi:hypothetical protein DFJ73DRAFT_87299 [Zopfochytrium polystomum]|nr:hypothetical protein DFJ73DRAFT_87299 [Zopfochytrium polystomum]